MELRLPEIGEGVTEAEIVRWLVKEGDQVKKFQPIVEVTTVKVNIEVPSPVEGKIVRILAREGEVVKVGQVIAVIEEVGAAVEERAPEAVEKPVAAQRVEEVAVRAERPKREILASPAVRRLARELGVPLEEVEGTGPGGRITEEDVRRYYETKIARKPAEAPPAPQPAQAVEAGVRGGADEGRQEGHSGAPLEGR
jgi:pyruvate dehydrogenase E2 component (dihydrolipoamide acetyltransferase)